MSTEDLECLGCGMKLYLKNENPNNPNRCYWEEDERREKKEKEEAEYKEYLRLKDKYKGKS